MRLPPRIAHLVARHRRSAWNRAVAKACRSYLNAFDNLDYDGDTNGEHALVGRMTWPAGSVVLDVGANVGSWSEVVRRRHPGCLVHAFEVDPVIAGQMATTFAGDAAVTVVAAGLADRAGPAVLHRSVGSTRGGSIVPAAPAARATADRSAVDRPSTGAGAGAQAADGVVVELERGDAYLARAGLDEVRFVKVDAEGSDLAVLRGFAGSLGEGRIDAVQFEHNESAIGASVHLKDFYDLLDPLGYEIGRVFPDCVLFRPWRATYEREAGGNHVAVRRDRPELRAEVAGAAL